MAEKKTVVRRGAPDKSKQLQNKKDRAKAKLVEQKIKAEELLADNYHEYMDILHKVATNTLGRDVSITNQVSTLKFLLTAADEVLKQEAQKNKEDTEEKEEVKVEETNKPLIQLFCSNDE